MSLKVLLIKPHYNTNEKYSTAVFPLGLLSIATFLKNRGYDPVILDTTIHDDYLSKINSHLKDALAVGISTMSAQVYSACKIAGFIREGRPDVPIIWGGVHSTLYPEDTARSPLVDIVVRGEGEETAVELLDCLKMRKPIHNVKGITYRDGGKIASTSDRPLLSEIPLLDYDLLYGMNKYIWADLHPFEKKKVRCIDVHAGRGCFYKCTFCFEKTTLRHRAKSAEVLASEITYLKEKFNIEIVNIQDSDFFADKNRLTRFVDLMIGRNIGVKWFSNCRSNYFNSNYINEELLKRLEASGCIKLGVGAESGSDVMLERMKKKTTVGQLKIAIGMLNKTGIWISPSFIIGMFDETDEDMKKTLKLILEITEESRNHYIIGPAYFRPYPGCEMFKRAIDYGFKPPKSLEEWGRAQKDRFGYLPIDKFIWLSNKKLARYIVNIVDFRHFKKHKLSQSLYKMFKKIIETRIKKDIWFCLYEDKLLLFFRGIVTFLRNRKILIRL